MPTVNIYINHNRPLAQRSLPLEELRAYIANVLSCGDRQLSPQEISLRVLMTAQSLPITPIEIEVHAFAYQERVVAQDSICRGIAEMFLKLLPQEIKPHVWLVLSELGHSWEE